MSYLDRFKALQTASSDDWYLRGDLLLVERLPAAEQKTDSGLIIAKADDHRMGFHRKASFFVRVIYTGAGTIDPETGVHHELDTQVGDIILIDEGNAVFFSTFGDMRGYEQETIGYTSEGSVKFCFRGQDAFERAFGILNQAVGEEETGGPKQ